MPRGNDAAEALRDLYSQYGPHSNASELIRAHALSIDPAVIRLGAIPVDVEETAKLKEDASWPETVAKKLGLPEGSEVLDASVRGNGLSVVYIDEHGETRKVAGAANDRYVAPKLTPQQARLRAEAEHDVGIRLEVARLREEADIRLNAAEAEINAATAQAIDEIRAKAQERLEAAIAETDAVAAEPAAGEPEAEPKSEAKPPARRKRTATRKGAGK